MLSNICCAQFNYLRPHSDDLSPDLSASSSRSGDADEVTLEDLVFERGSKLMLTVDFSRPPANIGLISDRRSEIHQHGSTLLRLMSDCVYWMASGNDMSKFPPASVVNSRHATGRGQTHGLLLRAIPSPDDRPANGHPHGSSRAMSRRN